MTEIASRLSTALADRYKIERHLGEGGMATVLGRGPTPLWSIRGLQCTCLLMRSL